MTEKGKPHGGVRSGIIDTVIKDAKLTMNNRFRGATERVWMERISHPCSFIRGPSLPIWSKPRGVRAQHVSTSAYRHLLPEPL